MRKERKTNSKTISFGKKTRKKVMNPLQPGVAYLYPLKPIRKPIGFLMFSGDIDKQKRAVMA